jgi:MarR family transcriptional regulator, organic hydroperoxide resistance regulator
MSVAPVHKADVTATAATEAWALIGQLFFEHGRPRMMALSQEYELSPPQSIVLRLLDEPRPMGELAQLMHCDNSNLTGIIDRLEERGLVERTQAEGDRRVRLIALTDRGREIREELNRRMAEPPEPLTELGEADQAQLRDILARALGS